MLTRISRISNCQIKRSFRVKNSTYTTTKMGDNNGEGEILMLQGKSGLCPFYMKQPKERMDLLFSKYENLLRKSLGEDVVAVYAMGSGAIPGMVGSPMVDILLAMKNSPPTEAQMSKLKELNIGLIGEKLGSPHDPNDTWFQNLDFPTQDNFDEFKLNGEFPPDGYLGRLSVHSLHYQNPFIGNTLCFVEYLTQNQEAFDKYQDVKVEGARMQSASSEKTEENTSTESSDALPKKSPFMKYKMHKHGVVTELLEESKKWREAGNFKMPAILSDSN